ncbi:unnamed protein product [Linum tenue]|uniref:Uncharacterized protein n=1 Tax=Linum tenue TaxID=586396 RepID=A0AAV0LA53_9ROSI|nr:unnamed protein product [Linum tenue]CAI0431390.1 unnamed protein product [Linum tenue]
MMRQYSLSLIPQASLPCFSPHHARNSVIIKSTFTSPKFLSSFHVAPSAHHITKQHSHNKKQQTICSSSRILHISKANDEGFFNSSSSSNLSIQLGALVAILVQPGAAYAVTGVNNEEDLTWTLIQVAIVAFWYFIIMPPVIMNWLRIRWYRRKLLEMYLQFMFVFLFFPGVMLWAPFLNFRKFPRDPSMKYPWSKPENPSQIKNDYLKYPFASPEDYE